MAADPRPDNGSDPHGTRGTARVNFPIFDRFEVSDYGMFPGAQEEAQGLHVLFHPGLTLVLGSNGLGKTTLVTMLFRMLTGPYDIPGLQGTSTLGSANLEPTWLRNARAIFADRVVDGARTATASLAFHLGNHAVVIDRHLRDLSVTRFLIDGQEFAANDATFQTEIPTLAGVGSFGDWILLLRQIVFYFEDRRALVWDPSAQRQVLRILLLPIETARTWRQEERAVLELDSHVRNLSATLYREEARLAWTEVKVEASVQITAELKSLEDLQDVDSPRREQIDADLVELGARREVARLRVLTAEQERESRYRDLERAKLIAIEARFPGKADTARYILAQLVTEGNCLVCGKSVPEVTAALEDRIQKERCVVCGSDISDSQEQVVVSTVSDRRVAKAAEALAAIEPELAEARSTLKDINREYESLVRELGELDKSMTQRAARIEALIQRLPPNEVDIHRQRSSLAMMRSHLELQRRDLATKRQAFGTFIEGRSREMAVQSGAIRAAFERYAQDFLIEKCNLTWSPQKWRVGQYGEPIEFPAYQLDMSAAGFESTVRRTGPEQVSESQREFIDLAFRMSLMEVAGSNGVGSLVIDAPESSLDAVFVGRAANVLARFAEPNRGNRLTITSNLVEGQLIPTLLRRSSTSDDRSERLVDLFKIAEPTAAIKQYGSQYEDVLTQMLAEVQDSSQRRRRE